MKDRRKGTKGKEKGNILKERNKTKEQMRKEERNKWHGRF
jgi:hypothetical protein